MLARTRPGAPQPPAGPPSFQRAHATPHGLLAPAPRRQAPRTKALRKKAQLRSRGVPVLAPRASPWPIWSKHGGRALRGQQCRRLSGRGRAAGRGRHGHPGSRRLLCARRGMGTLPRPWVRQWGQRPLGTRHGSQGPVGEGGLQAHAGAQGSPTSAALRPAAAETLHGT